MKDGKIQLVINTPSGRLPREDEIKIRSQVVLYNVHYTTTISGAQATVSGIEVMLKKNLQVKPLQKYHQEIKKKH
jgi:carbamoyl-phosphate synthase large subunit